MTATRSLKRALDSTDTPVLKTTYRDYMRPVFRGRMLLYDTHLVMQGWTLRGRYTRTWQLQQIRSVHWLRQNGPNLSLQLADGTRYLVKAKGPGIWWYVLSAYLS